MRSHDDVSPDGDFLALFLVASGARQCWKVKMKACVARQSPLPTQLPEHWALDSNTFDALQKFPLVTHLGQRTTMSS
jgi:hypothetical protein